MSKLLGLPIEELRAIPLFRGLEDDELASLTAVFQPVEAGKGAILFEAGQRAEATYVLCAGELALHQDEAEAYLLRGPAVIGELGALSGIDRTSRAVVGDDAVLYRARRSELFAFFDAHREVGLKFERNLLNHCADKIARDQRRLGDMRSNLIRTQKAMKQMRDFLLESPDTVVSSPLHATLEKLIKRNRRVNYRVCPPEALAAFVRLDDRSEAAVVQVSRTHVSFRPGDEFPSSEKRFSGVLSLSGPEIPISGHVLRVIKGRVDLELDLLLDEYSTVLESYLTRIQMLDYLV